MTEQDRSLSGDELAFARTFIAQIEPRFTFASTVPEHPHWYVARAWLAPTSSGTSTGSCS